MTKSEFATAPILNFTSIGLWSGDAKRPTSRNGTRISGCFGVATFLYRALLAIGTGIASGTHYYNFCFQQCHPAATPRCRVAHDSKKTKYLLRASRAVDTQVAAATCCANPAVFTNFIGIAGLRAC